MNIRIVVAVASSALLTGTLSRAFDSAAPQDNSLDAQLAQIKNEARAQKAEAQTIYLDEMFSDRGKKLPKALKVCRYRILKDMLLANRGMTSVKIDDGYFRRIHKDQSTTYFHWKKGEIYKIVDKDESGNFLITEAKNRHSEDGLSLWTSRVKRIPNSPGFYGTATIDDSYFEDVQKNEVSFPFALKKGAIYQAIDLDEPKDVVLIEIRDPDSRLHQWMPLSQLDLEIGPDERSALLSCVRENEKYEKTHATKSR